MDFIIVTYQPGRQGLLGPIRTEITITEQEAASVDEISEAIKVPLDGYCMIAKKQDMTIVKSTIVNQIVPATVESGRPDPRNET